MYIYIWKTYITLHMHHVCVCEYIYIYIHMCVHLHNAQECAVVGRGSFQTLKFVLFDMHIPIQIHKSTNIYIYICIS